MFNPGALWVIISSEIGFFKIRGLRASLYYLVRISEFILIFSDRNIFSPCVGRYKRNCDHWERKENPEILTNYRARKRHINFERINFFGKSGQSWDNPLVNQRKKFVFPVFRGEHINFLPQLTLGQSAVCPRAIWTLTRAKSFCLCAFFSQKLVRFKFSSETDHFRQDGLFSRFGPYCIVARPAQSGS